ncbi:MAG: energy transducer TonB [Bacteroidetes bacterium]|nr:energy transducer TonB [Bacteroidota bacterium]
MRITFLFLWLFLFAMAMATAMVTAVQAQPLSYGEKPVGFDGAQAPTDRAASLNTPLEVRYPDSAMRAQRQGVAVVAAWIDAKGYVIYAEVRRPSGHEDLDAEALRAVVDGDFKPAWRDGKPCASRISVPVEFRLKRSEEEYDAVKTGEQLEQEAEELRRARQMLEEEQRKLEEELRQMKEEKQKKETQK